MSSLPKSLNTAIAEGWCHTMPDVKTFTYEWTIHNFGWLSEPCGEYVESSVFPENVASGEPKWSLRAYPKGGAEQNSHYLEFDIVSHSRSEVDAKFNIALLNVEKVALAPREISMFSFTKDSSEVYVERFVELKYLEKYLELTQNTVTIFCQVSVVNDRRNISGQADIVKFQLPENKLSEDFGTILDNAKFSDVKLVVGGHELKAHKAILAGRSKVFAAILEHEMDKQTMNRVSIVDVDHEVLKEILRYMYTGKAPNLDTMAEDLFVVADQYDIKDLKLMCEEFLRKNISVKNTVNTLILADRHNAVQLKSQTIAFIIRNATRVMETQGWKDMKTTRSHLFEELFCALAQQLNIN